MPTGASGSGASSGAIRAGGAFVELFGKDHLTPALNKAQLKLASFGKFISSIGSSALRAGSVLLAPVAALFAGTLARSKEGVFGPQAQAHAQRFSDAWTRAILGLQSGLLPVLEILAPLMEQFAAVANQNKSVVLVIAGVAAGLLALGVAAKTTSAVMTLAAVAIGAVKLAIVAATSPLWLLVGAVIAFAASFANWGSLFGLLKETGTKAIGGVIGAFRSGQLELAGKIALAGLKLAWHDTIAWMKKEFGTLIEVLGAVAKMIVVIKAAQSGASIGSLFGPPVTAAGTLIGTGLGLLAVREIDKAVGDLMAGIGGGNRGGLVQELDDLLKQVKPLAGVAGVPSIAPEAVRGLFASPNFGRALSFGEGARVQEKIAAAAEKQVALLDRIEQNTRENRAVFA